MAGSNYTTKNQFSAWLDIDDAYKFAVETTGAIDGAAFLDRLESAWISGELTLTGIEPGGDKRISVSADLSADYQITFHHYGQLTRREPKPYLQFAGHIFPGFHGDASSQIPEGAPGLPLVAFRALLVRPDDIRRLFASNMTQEPETPAKPRGRRGEKRTTAKNLIEAKYPHGIPAGLSATKLVREIFSSADYKATPAIERPSADTLKTAAGLRTPSSKRRRKLD